MDHSDVTIVIPAKNEAASLQRLLPALRDTLPDTRILLIDDGSDDDTARIGRSTTGVQVISHPYSMGNGAAIKTGAREVSTSVTLFMHADGQHTASDASRLIASLNDGFEMAVGARRQGSHASMGRALGNWVYNRLATYVVGHHISDLTSGFRAVKTQRFREFLHLLPNGFSYPTTITMAFFRAGYSVRFVPIRAEQRTGSSHIRPTRDAVRFLLIIFRVATLYSPLKLFFPLSLVFGLIGIAYATSTLVIDGRFTNMSVVLFSLSILTFLMGLVSEQITALMYQGTNRRLTDET
jgi:glycosyltransferase involved in cell wall biosynthesis